jgi:hypothetical protein
MLEDADAELVKHRENMTDISGATTELQNLNRERQIVAAQEVEIDRLKQAAKTAALQWQASQNESNPFLPMIEAAKANIEQREQAGRTAKANRPGSDRGGKVCQRSRSGLRACRRSRPPPR